MHLPIPQPKMTIEQRRELTQRQVFLDGNRAKISGVYNDFATVWSDSNREGVTFSWNAVKRACEKYQGHFSS